MSEKRPIRDKYGQDKIVNFIQIYKIENNMLKKNRVFFKDYDGSLIEVPTKKVFVKTKELRKILKASDDGDPDNGLERTYRGRDVNEAVIANTYGEFIEVPIKDLCENTRNFINAHADPDNVLGQGT